VALDRMVRDLTQERLLLYIRPKTSAPGASTVRNDTESLFLHNIPRSRLPGQIPSGKKDPRLCLGIGRPPKTHLVDIEPKRGEDLW
jgi:hypothetical protein